MINELQNLRIYLRDEYIIKFVLNIFHFTVANWMYYMVCNTMENQ